LLSAIDFPYRSPHPLLSGAATKTKSSEIQSSARDEDYGYTDFSSVLRTAEVPHCTPSSNFFSMAAIDNLNGCLWLKVRSNHAGMSNPKF